jgi:hypothetical protein
MAILSILEHDKDGISFTAEVNMTGETAVNNQPPKAKMEGWLEKESAWRKVWRKRWFRLTPVFCPGVIGDSRYALELEWHRTKHDRDVGLKRAGLIKVTSVTGDEAADKGFWRKTKKAYQFVVVGVNETGRPIELRLVSPDLATYDQWMHSLSKYRSNTTVLCTPRYFASPLAIKRIARTGGLPDASTVTIAPEATVAVSEVQSVNGDEDGRPRSASGNIFEEPEEEEREEELEEEEVEEEPEEEEPEEEEPEEEEQLLPASDLLRRRGAPHDLRAVVVKTGHHRLEGQETQLSGFPLSAFPHAFSARYMHAAKKATGQAHDGTKELASLPPAVHPAPPASLPPAVHPAPPSSLRRVSTKQYRRSHDVDWPSIGQKKGTVWSTHDEVMKEERGRSYTGLHLRGRIRRNLPLPPPYSPTVTGLHVRARIRRSLAGLRIRRHVQSERDYTQQDAQREEVMQEEQPRALVGVDVVTQELDAVAIASTRSRHLTGLHWVGATTVMVAYVLATSRSTAAVSSTLDTASTRGVPSAGLSTLIQSPGEWLANEDPAELELSAVLIVMLGYLLFLLFNCNTSKPLFN